MILFRAFVCWLFCSVFVIGQNSPKNIILLIGDGMGINYVGASYFSDKENPYNHFKSIGFSVTTSIDKLIVDSAAGATALATGQPTKNKYLSVDSLLAPLKTVIETAKENNYSVGIISTSSVTHATPAAFYAHVDNRGKETDIAFQLSECNLDLIIGGGTQFFLPDVDGGKRIDDVNLIDKFKSSGYSYLDEYYPEQISNSSKVICLLERNGIKPAEEREYSLGDLTSAAINNLSKNENGFFLMVEGSQIDWAGHDRLPEMLMSEMHDFNTAIKKALEFSISDGNTLVLVTADHETGGMAITGGNLDGSELKLEFVGKSHTAGFVPVFASGPSEEIFRGIQKNYEIGQKLHYLLNPTKKIDKN